MKLSACVAALGAMAVGTVPAAPASYQVRVFSPAELAAQREQVACQNAANALTAQARRDHDNEAFQAAMDAFRACDKGAFDFAKGPRNFCERDALDYQRAALKAHDPAGVQAGSRAFHACADNPHAAEQQLGAAPPHARAVAAPASPAAAAPVSPQAGGPTATLVLVADPPLLQRSDMSDVKLHVMIDGHRPPYTTADFEDCTKIESDDGHICQYGDLTAGPHTIVVDVTRSGQAAPVAHLERTLVFQLREVGYQDDEAYWCVAITTTQISLSKDRRNRCAPD